MYNITVVQNMLKIYLNPAQTILFIEINLTLNGEQGQVYDALGRVMNAGYCDKGVVIRALVPIVYSLLYRNGTA